MLKKAMLGILAVALLAGTENLFAQGRKGRPTARQKQKQVEEGRQQRKGLRPRQQQFDKWLTALTKAYRENDSEKMGQLLRNMNQRRQKRQKETDAPGKRGQHFRHEGWEVRGRPEQLRERKDGRRGHREDLRGWHGRGFEHEGKGRRGGAFRRKSWREHAKGFRGEHIERCYPRFRGRGMGKRGRAFSEKVGHERGPHGEARERFARGDDEPGHWGQGPRHRRMGKEGRGFHGRGMGGWGRGLQGEGQRGWHRNGPPKGMHDRSQDESDFDWDW